MQEPMYLKDSMTLQAFKMNFSRPTNYTRLDYFQAEI